jgi:hypothetical protein
MISSNIHRIKHIKFNNIEKLSDGFVVSMWITTNEGEVVLNLYSNEKANLIPTMEDEE